MVSQASSQPGSFGAKTSVDNSSQVPPPSILESMVANGLARAFDQAEGTTLNTVSVIELIQDMVNQNSATPSHQPSEDISAAGLLMALITHVQKSNRSIAETNLKTESDGVVMDLRTRVAVLENELKHAQQEKGGLMTGLTTVIGLMSDARLNGHTPLAATSHLPAIPKSQDLEKEIERLRKENKGLRSKVRDAHANNATKLHNSDALQEFPPPKLANEPTVKIKSSHDSVIGPPFTVRKSDGQNLLSTALELAGSWAIKQQGLSPCEGFVSDPLTNGPGTSADSDNLQSKNVDVGIRSLEDILEGEEFGDPTVLPPTPTIQAKSQSTLPSDEPGPDFYLPDGFDISDEQCIDEAVAAMNKFNNFPAPGVLKVGGNALNSVRGYDPTAPIAPLGPRGWIDNGNPRRQGKPLYSHRRNQCRDLDAERAQYEDCIQDDQLSFPNSMWETKEERESVLRNHLMACGNSKELRFPDFFRYGIQFVPGKDDGNFMRTVHIEGLPVNIEMRDLLARVRGGDVMSATILDTKKIVGSMSATVVFKLEADALEYVKWIAGHPLTFTSSEDETKHPVTVTLISTPTFPPNPRIKSRLSISSRCICIPNFPAEIPIKSVKMDIGAGSKSRNEPMIEIWLDENNALRMEFCSIAIAVSAMDILSSRHNYRNLGVEVKFENDPCAGPVEELLGDVEPRPTLSLDELLKGRKAIETPDVEDKPVLALNTKIDIPSFKGEKLNTASWADEVIDEIEAGNECGTAVEVVSPTPKVSTCVTVETLKLLNDESNFGLAGLAGSRYATPAGSAGGKLVAPVGLSRSKYASQVSPARNRAGTEISGGVDSPPSRTSTCVTVETLKLLDSQTNFGLAGLSGSRFATPASSTSYQSPPSAGLLGSNYASPAGSTNSSRVPSGGLSRSKYATPNVPSSKKTASPPISPSSSKYAKPMGLSGSRCAPATVSPPNSLPPLSTLTCQSSKDMPLANSPPRLTLDELIAEDSISNIDSEAGSGSGAESHAIPTVSTPSERHLATSPINAGDGSEKPETRFAETKLAASEISTKDVSTLSTTELEKKAFATTESELAKNPRRSFGKFTPPTLKREKVRIKSKNPAFKATNMNGGMNEDEIELQEEL